MVTLKQSKYSLTNRAEKLKEGKNKVKKNLELKEKEKQYTWNSTSYWSSYNFFLDSKSSI